MTNDSKSESYPQTLEYCSIKLQLISADNLEYIAHIYSACVYYYLPLRAADNLDCLYRVVRREPIDHLPPCERLTLQNGQMIFVQPLDFLYVDESTLALIENYR